MAQTAAVKKVQSTPLGLLQARQCRTVEQEFSKTQRDIMDQVTDDQAEAENCPPTVVPSTTQFFYTI